MRSIALLLALAMPPLIATTASAGPIRVTYESSGSGKPVSILLPEDFTTAGFNFTLDWRRIPHVWPRPSHGTGPVPSREWSEGITPGRLTFDREPLGSSVYSPNSLSFVIRGMLTGTILDPGVGGVSGTLVGVVDLTGRVWSRNDTAEGTEFGPALYELWERDMGISRAFLDYLLTPGTMKLSATVTGGSVNLLPIELKVGPMPIPAPVPEPASWAAWGLAVAGAWAWRRRRAA